MVYFYVFRFGVGRRRGRGSFFPFNLILPSPPFFPNFFFSSGLAACAWCWENVATGFSPCFCSDDGVGDDRAG
jgi:hypothetical protein